jgi:LysM domain
MRAALDRHLCAGDGHDRLQFHPCCPICRFERLDGELDRSLSVGLRGQALALIAVTAATTVGPWFTSLARADSGDDVAAGVAALGQTPEAIEHANDPVPAMVDPGSPDDDLGPGDGSDDGGDQPQQDDAQPQPPPAPSPAPQAPQAEPARQPEQASTPPQQEPAPREAQDESASEAPAAPSAPTTSAPDVPASTAVEVASPEAPAPAPPDPSTEPAIAVPAPPIPAPPEGATKPAGPKRDDGRLRPPRGHERSEAWRRGDASIAASGRAVTAAAAAPTSRSAGDATARTTQVPPRRTGTYTVQPGDCLWSIARRILPAGASDAAVAAEVDRLWRLNADEIGTGDPNLIEPGQVLRLR